MIRDQRGSQQYWIDNCLLKGGWGREVGPIGVAVYNVLCLHANDQTQESSPSHATIARMIGVSVRQVIRVLKKLGEFNLVRIESRQATRQVSIYTLLHHSQWISPPAPAYDSESHDSESHDSLSYKHEEDEEGDSSLKTVSSSGFPSPAEFVTTARDREPGTQAIVEALMDLGVYPRPALDIARECVIAGVDAGQAVAAFNAHMADCDQQVQIAVSRMQAGFLEVKKPKKKPRNGHQVAASPTLTEPPKLTPEDVLWSAVLGELHGQMTKATFDVWLAGTRLVQASGDQYTIEVPNVQAVDWLSQRLHGPIERTLAGHVGRPAVTVHFQAAGRAQPLAA